MTESVEPSQTRVRVWDVPIRLVHWLLVALVALSWWTAENDKMDWHRYSGYTLLGLVSFRLYWGLFGSSTARFRQFVRGPRSIRAYLKGRRGETAGHNPLGALSVVALIGLLALQIGLGLFAVDVDGIESGPLSAHVSFETGRVAAQLHHRVFNVLLVFIAIHVIAVAYYLIGKKQNLIGTMFHGTRAFDQPVEGMKRASVLRLIIGVLLAAAVTWVLSRG